jgi:hypothetical protein
MGRFYKTAKSIFLDDKMFQLPAELMANVIQKQDSNIDENLGKIDAFNDTLKIENLKTDDPAVNERLQGYKDKIDHFTNEIFNKPLDYRRYKGRINNLSRELDTELNKGLLGKAQEQYSSFNTEMERISKLTNVSADKKDQLKRAIQKQYSDRGGLNFQDENTYNQISEFFETPLEDVDTDKLINTIATNFKADTTADAKAGPDGKGYIWTSKGTIEIRDEQDVADYMETTLKENGWEDQLRQELKWRKINGEDINIDQVVASKKNEVIEQAKNKLGYRKETEAKSVSTDGAWTFKQAQRERQAKAEQGMIIKDQRDYRKILNPDGRRKYSDADIEKFENRTRGKMLQLGQKLNIEDLETFKDNYIINGSLKSINKELTELGLTKKEVIDYLNYQNDNKELLTPHIPGFDKLTEAEKDANPDLVRKQQTYLKTVIKGMNGINYNDTVKNIIIYEDGIPKQKSYKTMAELVQDNEQYVFIPATGTVNNKDLKKAPDGTLLDSDGDIIMDNEGNPIKTFEQAQKAGVAADIVYDTKSLTTYDTDQSLLQFNAGNIKESDNFEIKYNGMVDTTGVYIGNNKFFRVDKSTGERKLIETEIQVDKNDLNIKFQR